MPLYEYQCADCNHRFEVIQKFSDPPVEVCPKCGGPVRKLIASPAFQFKGSGWYITDYARKGDGAAKSEEGKPAGTGTAEKPAASETKSDTAAKTDTAAATPKKSDKTASDT
jgi:putative FmdB family regulatory protein